MIKISRVYIKDFGGSHRRELRVDFDELDRHFAMAINADAPEEIGEAFEDIGYLIASDTVLKEHAGNG